MRRGWSWGKCSQRYACVHAHTQLSSSMPQFLCWVSLKSLSWPSWTTSIRPQQNTEFETESAQHPSESQKKSQPVQKNFKYPTSSKWIIVTWEQQEIKQQSLTFITAHQTYRLYRATFPQPRQLQCPHTPCSSKCHRELSLPVLEKVKALTASGSSVASQPPSSPPLSLLVSWNVWIILKQGTLERISSDHCFSVTLQSCVPGSHETLTMETWTVLTTQQKHDKRKWDD